MSNCTFCGLYGKDIGQSLHTTQTDKTMSVMEVGVARRAGRSTKPALHGVGEGGRGGGGGQ